MKTRNIFRWLALLPLAAVISCTDDMAEQKRAYDMASMPVSIAVGFDEGVEADTRTATDITNFVTPYQNLRLYYTTTGSTYSATPNSNYAANGVTSIAVASANNAIFFPAGENTVKMYGWYPALDTSKTFTVLADQSTDEGYVKSDLMVANEASCVRNLTTGAITTNAALTFRHLLSRIKLQVSTGADVYVTSVKLKNVKRQLTINDGTKDNLSYSSVTSVSGTDVTLFSGTISPNATNQAMYGVIPPQDIAAGEFIEVTAKVGESGASKTVKFNLGTGGKTFETNQIYTISLTVNKQNMGATITMSPWTESSSTAATIEATVEGGGGTLAMDKSEVTLTYGGSAGSVTISTSGSYGVQSNNASIATASVSGTTVTITPTGAGTAKVFVYPTNGNSESDYGTIDVTVNKATGSVTLDKSSVSDIYKSGGTATVNVTAHSGTGAITASSSNTGIATVSVEGTVVTVTGAGTAGTATITVTAAADANYNEATATFTATTGDKSPASVTTAPTAKSLTYNGSDQALVNTGVASGGTMYYKLGSSGSWTTSVPQASGMGPYTVYYYVKGDDTHLDTGSESSPAGNVSVTFSKGTPTLSLSPASATIAAGNNTTATISRSSSNPGTLSVSAQSNSSVATGSISGTTLTVNGVAAGSATITVKVASNTYWNERTVTFTATVKTSVTTTLSALKSSWNANYLGASVYSDGTVGWATSISGKTRIGIVAYYADSDVDSAISGSRILVLAIANAATCPWGHYGTLCDGTTHGSYTYSKSGNSGYTQTQALCNNGSDSSTHPAAYNAWNYSATIPSGGASPGHWFLPSRTQWGWMSAQRGYAGISSGGCWSSTEYDSNNAYNLRGDSGVDGSGYLKNYTLNNVRACFAY